MEQKKYRVFGEYILVEKVIKKLNVMDKEGTFNNRVKVLAIGEDLKEKTLVKVDDILVIGGLMEKNGETYIAESQILRWE